MKRIVNPVLLTLLLTATVVCQTNEKADTFHGLVLNQTSSEDAIKVLGQPAADKTDRLDLPKLSKWLDAKTREKIFRQLSFKNVGDFSQIKLSFLDNKLVAIELEFKKTIMYVRLSYLFGVEFAIVGAQGGASDLPNEPGKYPVRFIPTYYPFTYNLIGISERTFIWVDCTTGDAARPGRVDRTHQISRVLQKK